jgi:uncharacterized protein (DUF305 family)
METKPLLTGIIGFLLGGLLVSTAAVTFDKPSERNGHTEEMSMSRMTESLASKNGDDYDKLFISYMIDYHASAVDMAKLSPDRAKHDEIKKLSRDIITAQEREITQMKHWQKDWNYSTEDLPTSGH